MPRNPQRKKSYIDVTDLTLLLMAGTCVALPICTLLFFMLQKQSSISLPITCPSGPNVLTYYKNSKQLGLGSRGAAWEDLAGCRILDQKYLEERYGELYREAATAMNAMREKERHQVLEALEKFCLWQNGVGSETKSLWVQLYTYKQRLQKAKAEGIITELDVKAYLFLQLAIFGPFKDVIGNARLIISHAHGFENIKILREYFDKMEDLGAQLFIKMVKLTDVRTTQEEIEASFQPIMDDIEVLREHMDKNIVENFVAFCSKSQNLFIEQVMGIFELYKKSMVDQQAKLARDTQRAAWDGERRERADQIRRQTR